MTHSERRLQAVLFDFDGVILDSETALYEAWQRVYEAHGAFLPLERWAANIGGYNYDVFDPLVYLSGQIGRVVDRDTINTARRACYLYHVHRQEAMPGVREAIATAKAQGLKLAVVSSSSRNWVHGHLKRLGLYNQFDAFACGDEAAQVKPDPELYHMGLERLGVSAERSFVVEDSPKGIAAARAASLYCVVVPNSVTSASPLKGYDKLLESLAAQPFEEIIAAVETSATPAAG